MHSSPRQMQPKEEVDKDLLKAAETIADQLLAGLPGSPPAISPISPPKLPSPPPVEVHAKIEITAGGDIPTEAEVSDLELDGQQTAEKEEVKPAAMSPSVVVKEATPPPSDDHKDDDTQKDVTVIDTEEDYSKTTKIRKREETYSLLVKVAESLGQSLAAKIIIDAMHDAARHLATTAATSSSEESESEGGVIKISPSLTLAPTFEISKETYNIHSGENVTIHTRIEGAPCSKVEWFKEGMLVEENDQISVITTEGHTQLVMKKVGKYNSGIYTAVATNPYGTATYQCTIHVTDSDGEIAGPYVTEIKKAEAEPTQTISNNVEIHKKHDQFDQEVIVEYLPFENIEERAVAKTTKKRSRDEQKKKKRLSMESLKSNGSEASDRMETIDEPSPQIGDEKAVEIVSKTEGAAEAVQETDETTLREEEIKVKDEPQNVTPTDAAALPEQPKQPPPEEKQISAIEETTTPISEQQKVSEIAPKEEEGQQNEIPVIQEQQTPESQEQETHIVVKSSGTEQHTEVDVTEKIEELTPQGVVKREEDETTAFKADTEQQNEKPKEVVLSFDKSVGKEQTITIENVETIEIEKDIIEPKMDENVKIEEDIVGMDKIKMNEEIEKVEESGNLKIDESMKTENMDDNQQPKSDKEIIAAKPNEEKVTEVAINEERKTETAPTIEEQIKTAENVTEEVKQTGVTKQVEKVEEAKIPTMEEFMSDTDIAEFVNKLVEAITSEATTESEQQLKELLAEQSDLTQAEEPRQTTPSPTKAILTLEEQLKQLQKDLDESGLEIHEDRNHELNIEKEFEKEVEREEALAEARKRYSREPSEDTILEEPEIEETFEVISKQDVKLSKDGIKGQASDTLPQSPTEFREICIPEITLTNESGEPVVEMTTSITDIELISDIPEAESPSPEEHPEISAPEVNIEITKEDATFTYHLRIVQPQLLIISAELSGTLLSNQRIISVNEDITKIPDQSGIEVSVLTPALTKENVIYKWILKKEGGATESRDTWILNRLIATKFFFVIFLKEEPTSPTSPEATAIANINVAYSGPSHPIVEISMLEPSKLLTEVLSEIPKSQSTTTSLTSQTQTYVTAHEGLDYSEDPIHEPLTLDERSQSTITETSTSGINQAPSFRQEIQNATFVAGQSAQLKCIVAGNPSPQVQWFVDGDEIQSNE
uniref:Ig-like domain-containing protein n=1 Tax=Panagrolaimus superbus TaxID=310955 RepID=A0A914YBH0_9BILA